MDGTLIDILLGHLTGKIVARIAFGCIPAPGRSVFLDRHIAGGTGNPDIAKAMEFAVIVVFPVRIAIGNPAIAHTVGETDGVGSTGAIGARQQVAIGRFGRRQAGG